MDALKDKTGVTVDRYLATRIRGLREKGFSAAAGRLEAMLANPRGLFAGQPVRYVRYLTHYFFDEFQGIGVPSELGVKSLAYANSNTTAGDTDFLATTKADQTEMLIEAIHAMHVRGGAPPSLPPSPPLTSPSLGSGSYGSLPTSLGSLGSEGTQGGLDLAALADMIGKQIVDRLEGGQGSGGAQGRFQELPPPTKVGPCAWCDGDHHIDNCTRARNARKLERAADKEAAEKRRQARAKKEEEEEGGKK